MHIPTVTLGEIRNVIQQNKPNYPWDKEIVCATEDGIWCVYSKGAVAFIRPQTPAHTTLTSHSASVHTHAAAPRTAATS